MSPIHQQLGEYGDHLAAERVREAGYMVIAHDCRRNTVQLNSISAGPYHIDVMTVTRTLGGELVYIEQLVDGVGR